MTVLAAAERAPLATPAWPDHARWGDTPAALAAIRDPGVTLAIWRRSPPLAVVGLQGFENVRLTTRPDDAAGALAAALSASRPFAWLPALVDDATLLAGRLASIMVARTVEIRVDRIVGDACRRFHADYVAARLLCTYAGRGTEWLDQDAAARLAAGAAADPRSLATGEVAILKGRDLAGDAALVHRSPPIADRGEERLLLVIDPVD